MLPPQPRIRRHPQHHALHQYIHHGALQQHDYGLHDPFDVCHGLHNSYDSNHLCELDSHRGPFNRDRHRSGWCGHEYIGCRYYGAGGCRGYEGDLNVEGGDDDDGTDAGIADWRCEEEGR